MLSKGTTGQEYAGDHLDVMTIAEDEASAQTSQWQVFVGLKEILRRKERLAALAERCGQQGAVEELEYLLTGPNIDSQHTHAFFGQSALFQALAPRSKRPILLLKVGAETIEAAVLLNEYKICGLPTGALVPVDPDGRYTVIAPIASRQQAAIEAANLLFKLGRARLVLLSCIRDQPKDEEGPELSQRFPPSCPRGGQVASPYLRAYQTREIRRELLLRPTFDETLAAMGAHTRRNLRAAQRRLVKQLGCSYFPAAGLSEREFVELNRSCTYRVPDWFARWRYRSVHTVHGGFLAGLRTSDGRWLSLVGGRRLAAKTYVDWQMNREESRTLSLGTAMRAFLLQEEQQRASHSIYLTGGTSHSMSSAFRVEQVCDLLFARWKLSPRFIRRLARLLPSGGLLSGVILNDELTWH